MIKIIIPAIILIGLAVIGLAIRILLVKNGKFSKRCSSGDAGNEGSKTCECSGSGKNDTGQCKNFSMHHPEEKS